MKTSFSARPENKPEPAPSPDAPKPTEPMVPATTGNTTTALGLPSSDIQGDFQPSDLRVPQLQLVQSVGPLSETFTPGQIVLAKETVLAQPDGKPIVLTVAKLRKQYIENLPYSEDNLGAAKVVDTLEQVHTEGGTIEWVNNQPPTWVPIVTVLLVVEQPEGMDDQMFCYEFGEKRYATALWRIRGMAYPRAAVPIITASKFALKDGLDKGSWLLKTRREKSKKGNFVHMPVLRQNTRNSPEFVEFVKSITGA